MRVLLVEDDDRIARDVTAALAAGGYVVERERDGEEAWFKGDTEDYAAIVLDLGLPGMDGLSILKRWRANGRAMPVLILTARDTWIERVEGIDSRRRRLPAQAVPHGGTAGAAACHRAPLGGTERGLSSPLGRCRSTRAKCASPATACPSI